MALTNAEKQKRFRQRMKARGFKVNWLPAKETFSAAAIAKKRLDDYLDKKLTDEHDEAEWEFYTWLLNQAKKHPVDTSGFCSIQYQDDHRKAIALIKERRNAR
jgi:hypothetical protein